MRNKSTILAFTLLYRVWFAGYYTPPQDRENETICNVIPVSVPNRVKRIGIALMAVTATMTRAGEAVAVVTGAESKAEANERASVRRKDRLVRSWFVGVAGRAGWLVVWIAG